MKICSKCKEEKEEEAFYKDRTKSSGFSSYCKLCDSARIRNKEADRLAKLRYAENNKEKIKAARKLRREVYKDTIKAQKAASYLRNREKVIRKAGEWAKANPERRTEIGRRWREQHLEQAKNHSVTSALNQIKNHPEKMRLKTYARYVSLLFKPLILKRDNYVCKLCGIAKNLTIHHIIPKSIDETLIAEESNLITLCRECHKNKAHDGHWRKINSVIQQELLLLIKKEYENG